jgi:hypothetical protein
MTELHPLLQDPKNGFRVIVLPLKDAMEVAVYTGT